MTKRDFLCTLLWVAGLAAPALVSCSDDAGTPGVPRGKTSFGGSYSGPVTGPGSDASLPAPPEAGTSPDSSAPAVDCVDSGSAWDCTCVPDSKKACTCGDGGPPGTQTCRPSGAGYNPCDCGTPPNDKLGAPCAKSDDCGAGLICLTSESNALDGQGPPGGLCTRDCVAGGAVCDKVKAGAKCVGFPDQTSSTRYCLEGCEFGTPDAGSKCHGRFDMGCGSYVVAGLGEVGRLCFPTCNANDDCGPGWLCDPGTGRCFQGAAPPGDPIGASCTQGSGKTCRGYCEKLDLPLTSSSTQLCAERCTAGALAANKLSCGWKLGTVAPAQSACIYYPGTNPSPGAGDRGACGQLCDCNSQCTAPGLVCQPLTGGLDTLFKRKGQCSPPTAVDGGAVGIVTCS